MKNTKKIITVAGLLTMTMFINQECQSQAPQAPQQPAAAPAQAAPVAAPAAAPAAMGGGVKAVVKFSGTPPPMMKLKREADPFCAKTPMNDQEIVVNPNGTLKNVAIRISQGAQPMATPPATSIEVDQTNCMYAPRVLAAVVGQKMIIHNSDPILHNVHTYTGTTTGFNQAQMKGSKDIEKTVSAGVTKFKCDVHPWMTGYVVGNDNPFVCVTGDTGECMLAGVPDGTYTVEAWQEKYGAKTAQLTVAGGKGTVEFAYAAQ
jgi:plastocyanin